MSCVCWWSKDASSRKWSAQVALDHSQNDHQGSTLFSNCCKIHTFVEEEICHRKIEFCTPCARCIFSFHKYFITSSSLLLFCSKWICGDDVTSIDMDISSKRVLRILFSSQRHSSICTMIFQNKFTFGQSISFDFDKFSTFNRKHESVARILHIISRWLSALNPNVGMNSSFRYHSQFHVSIAAVNSIILFAEREHLGFLWTKKNDRCERLLGCDLKHVPMTSIEEKLWHKGKYHYFM